MSRERTQVPPMLSGLISYRQLDYWVRKGWLRPDSPSPGSGRQRHWPPSEVRVALTMARLVGAGVDPAEAAAAARRSRPRGLRVAGLRRRRIVEARLSPHVAVRVTQ